jgi:hypothetical protein
MRPHKRFHSALLFVSTALFLLGNTQAQQADNQPIITFNQLHPMLQSAGSEPMVQVFASGLVKINRRPGRLNPGQFEHTLNTDELAQLIALAEDAGIASFVQTSAAQQDDGQQFFSSDPTTTILQFNRVRGSEQLADGASEVAQQLQTVAMDDVVMQASMHPQDSLLTVLNNLEEVMMELFARTGE